MVSSTRAPHDMFFFLIFIWKSFSLLLEMKCPLFIRKETVHRHVFIFSPTIHYKICFINFTKWTFSLLVNISVCYNARLEVLFSEHWVIQILISVIRTMTRFVWDCENAFCKEACQLTLIPRICVLLFFLSCTI